MTCIHYGQKPYYDVWNLNFFISILIIWWKTVRSTSLRFKIGREIPCTMYFNMAVLILFFWYLFSINTEWTESCFSTGRWEHQLFFPVSWCFLQVCRLKQESEYCSQRTLETAKTYLPLKIGQRKENIMNHFTFTYFYFYQQHLDWCEWIPETLIGLSHNSLELTLSIIEYEM